MPCGAVFQNITGISKKKTIEYTEEELELLDKRRQDIDIEFKILEREKGCKIYPHQKKMFCVVFMVTTKPGSCYRV